MALLAVAACGTSRPAPPHPGDAGIGPPPLSVVLTPQPFAPAALALDDDGNLVALDATQALLHTLNHDGLAEMAVHAVGDAGAWSSPQLAVGRPGIAFIADAASELSAVDLATDLPGPVMAIGAHAVVRALRASFGVAVATAGQVQLRDLDGGEELLDVGAAPLLDLAPTPAGPLIALRGDGVRCARVELLLGDAGTAGDFGSPPCVLALSRDGRALWVAGQGDGGAVLHQLDGRTLGEVGRWALAGVQATEVVLSPDGARVAVLGQAPGPTVALARSSDLAAENPFRTLGPMAVQSAAAAVFDDADALYIADPLGQSVDLVR